MLARVTKRLVLQRRLSKKVQRQQKVSKRAVIQSSLSKKVEIQQYV